MKIDKSKPRHWLLLIRQGLYTLLATCGRYLLKRPGKPVVILYGHQLSGNLKALYEEWQRSHSAVFDCYFLSLDPEYSETLHRQGVNVLRCGSLSDMLRVGRSSAIITDHGLHAMSPFIRLTNIVFIDVWHGIPFKGFIPDDFRVQHRYDEVWVSSPLLKDIYVKQYGFPAEAVHPMGYARADKLFLGQQSNPDFRKDNAIPANNKVVLYAPTWQQDDKGRDLFPFDESQSSFIKHVSEVCRAHNATLVIRSHLNASIISRIFDNVLYCSMKDYPDTEDLLSQTDVLICDWSSISFDFLALKRPTLFLDVEPPFRNGFSLDQNYRFGLVVGAMEGLLRELGNCLDSPDEYHRNYAEKFEQVTADVYDHHTDGQAAARQIERLIMLLSES